MSIPFVSFNKIPRWSRQVIVTEKLDGTNAQVHITDDLLMFAGSRNRWITLEDDNFGFAKWVEANKVELYKLGPGTHYGEWWGSGIQRKYGLKEKRFSLFNVSRWADDSVRPECCGVVPKLWEGPLDEMPLGDILGKLKSEGSVAAPGFMNPEGIVIYHAASKQLFKKTLEHDADAKSLILTGPRLS
jgi:hypothetical protein